MTEPTDTEMQPPALSDIELRVLGALMEKQLTTPDQYPLTLNSLMSACNQKSSRDPVSSYTQGEIARTLQQLQDKRFVNKEYGSRAEKYSQQLIRHLELGRKHQALLCVMMLRGPQSVSELNTRTQRMVEFTDKDDLEHTLDRLCSREVPYSVQLGHQPGQRGERYVHLFSGPVENAAPSPQKRSPEVGSEQAFRADALHTQSTGAESLTVQPAVVTDRVSLELELQATILELKSVKRQLERLYELTGHEIDADQDD